MTSPSSAQVRRGSLPRPTPRPRVSRPWPSRRSGVGGQAATSAKIRNYLGFPWGIRGADLAAQASQQATQLGAEVIVAREATALHADGDGWALTLSSGDVLRARAVILAGGVTYRRTGVADVDALIGHGVFYGAAAGEAASMSGLRVAILGGGNSAGQAAAHLAAAGAEVTVLIRGDALSKSMSAYLVQQLEGTPNVTVRTQVVLTGARGEGQLAALVLEHAVDGVLELHTTPCSCSSALVRTRTGSLTRRRSTITATS